MKLLSPDFLTAFSMTAMFAIAVAWVVWMLGRQYHRQGLGLALLSTLSFAFGYMGYSLHQITHSVGMLISAKLFISLAISLFTLALQVFRHHHRMQRDLLTIVAPLLGTLAVAFWYLPYDGVKFNVWHSTIIFIQTVFCLRILLEMRSRTPGIGWVFVCLGIFVQLVTLLPILSSKHAYINLTVNNGSDLILTLWAICFMLLLKLMMMSFGFLVMLRDHQAALEQGKARLDYLTQLPTRSALIEGLQHAAAQASEGPSPLTLMLIDIDHFDQINTQYGHLAGDQIIHDLAEILKQQCRSTDLASRYGAEQFVLLLPNTTIQGAEILAERLCETVRQHTLHINSDTLHFTISIGVHCSVPEANSPWETLMDGAKKALFSAKKNGRNRFALSTPSMLE